MTRPPASQAAVAHQHPVGGGIAARDGRSLPRLLATAGGAGLEAHIGRWGRLPSGGPALIDEVERAGLRGRGGAAFPTAQKLRAVGRARRSTVVVNGVEREPLSIKDRTLLVSAPHLVLDGASLAAESVGAGEVILCADRSARTALQAAEAALRERRAAGVDRVSIRLEATPSRYVTGEESALVHWLNGGEAKPTVVPPRPFERGVGGHPTLVNNVETLAHLALIARFGAEWFAGLGTQADPGTALLTLSGHVTRPGLYEVPLGIPLTEALQAASVAGDVQAVLVGGYFGTWIAGAAIPTLGLDRASLGRVGAALGCGAIFALGAGRCGLAETARVTRWLAGESAGQCGPCAHGLPAIAGAVEGLVAGDRSRRREEQVRRWTGMVEGRGACKHPDGAVRFVRSAVQVFAADIEAHRRRGPCLSPGPLLPAPDLGESWR